MFSKCNFLLTPGTQPEQNSAVSLHNILSFFCSFFFAFHSQAFFLPFYPEAFFHPFTLGFVLPFHAQVFFYPFTLRLFFIFSPSGFYYPFTLRYFLPFHPLTFFYLLFGCHRKTNSNTPNWVILVVTSFFFFFKIKLSGCVFKTLMF